MFKVKHDPMKSAFGYSLVFNGVKIVICGDTTLIESLAVNAQNADILINEVYSTPLHYDQVKRSQNIPMLVKVHNLMTYHTDSWKLAKMAELAHVKNLVFTHVLPSIPNDIQAKKEFTAGMSDYYSGLIIVADDGGEIIVAADTKTKGSANSSIIYKLIDPDDFYNTAQTQQDN